MERGEIRLKNDIVAVLDGYPMNRGVPLPPGAVLRRRPEALVDLAGSGKASVSVGNLPGVI